MKHAHYCFAHIQNCVYSWATLMNSIDATFLRISQFKSDPKNRSAQLCNVYDQMNVMLAGETQISDDTGEWTLKAGDIAFYRAGHNRREKTTSEESAECYSILFKWTDALRQLPPYCRDSAGRIRLLTDWLVQGASPLGYKTSIENTGLLHAIIGEYVRLTLTEKSMNHELVIRLQEYVAKHIADPISLDDLAKYVCMDKFHFIRKYKELTTHTPMDDVRRQRIQQAQYLVITTDRPLAEIAESVGIANSFHLSRLFRKYFGKTPRDYRK
jgi:AraC-like DNA-binding protein